MLPKIIFRSSLSFSFIAKLLIKLLLFFVCLFVYQIVPIHLYRKPNFLIFCDYACHYDYKSQIFVMLVLYLVSTYRGDCKLTIDIKINIIQGFILKIWGGPWWFVLPKNPCWDEGKTGTSNNSGSLQVIVAFYCHQSWWKDGIFY